MNSQLAQVDRTSAEKERVRSEITFDVVKRQDLPRLSRLIQATRREDSKTMQLRDHSPAYYDWMYFRNPAGQAIVFAGKHRGQLVTSFAMTPKRIQFGPEVVLCGKTMDMFTHPEYQGMGLISEVTSLVLRAARARGIQMWYVTPSERSYPIFLNKWHYVESFRVNYVVRVLDYTSLLGSIIHPRLLGRLGGCILNLGGSILHRVTPPACDFQFRSERVFGPETDRLWSECRSYRLALVRDAAYMTWRYLENPDHYDVTKVYRGSALRGILVTKLTTRRGVKVGEFVECLAAPDDAEAKLAMYRHGLRLFQEQGCAFAQNWAIENSRSEREMQACGIARRRRRVAVLFSPDAPRKELYDPEAWFLSPGDGNDI